MVYESIEFNYPNFCIGPKADNFCSIDHENDWMQVKNSTGDLIKTYDLDTSIDNEIKSIEYAGPRDLSQSLANLGEDLPFFTLDRDDVNGIYFVREWRLSTANSKLELENTISGSTGDVDCYDMSIEYYHTGFAAPTATGTGQIQVDSLGKMEAGDNLLLGPSGDADNLNDFEWVEITSISGGWVYITAPGPMPPKYEYTGSDDISYYKSIFLFSDTGENGDETKGALYKINPYDLNPSDPTILDTRYSGLYSNVRSSAWSTTYQSIGMVKGSNLLYVDPNNDYEIQKSHALTNIQADDVTNIPIYDLVFLDPSTIYRLQKKITLNDDEGNKTTTSWDTYNYHRDTVAPYTKSISSAVDPDCIVLHSDQVEITAVVRDQFGVGLSSKLVYFTKAGGDPSGSFDPVNGQVYTDANGIATITYETGDYDLGGTNAEINIKAKTDGASTLTGSQYVWDNVSLFLYSNFTTDLINLIQKPTLIGAWPIEGSDLYTQLYMTQVSGMQNEMHVKSLSKFQFPGGHWIGSNPPEDEATSIRQLEKFEGEKYVRQLEEVDIETSLFQKKEISNDLQLSQIYISRHLSTGHKDDVDIDQFRFIEDALPAFWSEKNPVNTDIWIRLRPFAFSLNQDTLIFKVKEISYAGDTGYKDVASSCSVSTFDAGGGLLGLDITYNPSNDFHHNGVVYVSIEVCDNAAVPNIILTDYWFRIIPDYKSPYIVNENPAREEENVVTNTNISFDILDAGVGVNINTLELHVNSRRIQTHIISAISGGYHISYNPDKDFYYSQSVEITIKVEDASDYRNMLYDMWRFYIAGSTGPWIDRGSFDPRVCARGVYRKQTGISFNVYGIDDTGVDRESILVTIGGKTRDVTIIPIIYRLE